MIPMQMTDEDMCNFCVRNSKAKQLKLRSFTTVKKKEMIVVEVEKLGGWMSIVCG